MMQPILVTQSEDGKLEILAGERRWRAAQMAGMKQVPVLIRPAAQSDGERLELALIENIQREDLNPIERGQACQRLIAQHGYTQELVADRLGYQRSTVSNLLRLLELPVELQSDVSRETLTAGHARALLQLQGSPLQSEARKRVLEEGLSVRQTEELCKEWSRKGATPKHRARPRKPAWVVDLQEKVARSLGVRTELQLLSKGGGKLILHFKDLEQLDGFTQRLGGRSEAEELLEG
jgi:ParB family chromosome partitioning protein